MQTFHVEAQKVQSVLKEVISLEKVGDYESAFGLLGEVWTDKSESPDVHGLPLALAAELLLRCGAVIGFVGSLKQIANAQENSKNLLTLARNKFLQLFKTDKVAECENFLALAYYRKGEYKEAAVYVEEALSHKLNRSDEIRLHSHIIKTVILLAETKFNKVISYLDSVRDDFDKADALSKGCYCTNLSLAYKNIGQLDKSLRHLNFARFCHQQSRHRPYLATVENNLAQLYKLRSEFSKALESADNAITLFSEIGDRARKAFTIDTKAQICIAKKDFGYAVDLADEAIEILKFGDSAGRLSEVYLTKANALVGLGKIAESVVSIFEALQLAKVAGESQVKKIAESFELSIFAQFPPKTKKLYSEKQKTIINENFQLDLPPDILPNQEFYGVWIKNKDFEKLGLKQGNLALVAKTQVKKGDLVAVSDNATDLVSIGFYENDFGLICLENYSSEPELLSENEVTIMGKIVGFCEPTPNSDGRHVVKPVLLSGNISENGSENLMD